MPNKIKGILTLENESELFVDAVKENSYTPSSGEIGMIGIEKVPRIITGGFIYFVISMTLVFILRNNTPTYQDEKIVFLIIILVQLLFMIWLFVVTRTRNTPITLQNQEDLK